MILSQVIEYAWSVFTKRRFPSYLPGPWCRIISLILKEKRTFETTWIRSSQMKTQIND